MLINKGSNLGFHDESYHIRRLGNLIIALAAFILLEGVLRKWLLNPIEKPLIFIREPILFAIYYFYAKDFGIKKTWFFPYILFSAIIIFLALTQAIYWNLELLIPFIGIRFYILYIPLAFIMGEVLTEIQLVRLIKFLLCSSIPIGILVILQFILPVEHYLNKGLSDDVEGRFIVVEGIVRPYGPFTFTSAQSHWSPMLLALIIIGWENRNRFMISKKLLAFSSIFTLIMGAMSGSRTYFGFAILVLFFYILAGFTSSKIVIGFKRLLYALIFLISFLLVFIFAFPKAYESMSQRQEDAVSSEGSTLDRVINSFTEAAQPFNTAPPFGYGIGSGSNASRIFRNGDTSFILGENEWIRMINELGPIFGYPVLLFRILLVLWLFYLALKVNRKTSNGSALILFGFVGYCLLASTITIQNQLLAICWFAVGLLLAFIRVFGERIK